MHRLVKLDSSNETFLTLVRMGVSQLVETLPDTIDWEAVEDLAFQHGLIDVVADGIELLTVDKRPPERKWLKWKEIVSQDETRYAIQQKAAFEMSLLLHENGIRTYVLKGAVVAECYPKPEHRVSSDMDCFLLDKETVNLGSNGVVWEKGNTLIENAGYEVVRGYYKNSSFHLPGLIVENHQFLVPFRGNKTLKRLEKLLQINILGDKVYDRFEGVWLYRPPVMVSALFLIEHAYSHFLHEGLTWRHVLDWMMFSHKHSGDIDWDAMNSLIDEYGFRKFYDTYYKLGRFLLGEVEDSELDITDQMMLADVWSELDMHETLLGVKGKLALVGNTWRARWKYRYFADISMLHALWIQVKGFLFLRHPRL